MDRFTEFVYSSLGLIIPDEMRERFIAQTIELIRRGYGLDEAVRTAMRITGAGNALPRNVN